MPPGLLSILHQSKRFWATLVLSVVTGIVTATLQPPMLEQQRSCRQSARSLDVDVTTGVNVADEAATLGDPRFVVA